MTSWFFNINSVEVSLIKEVRTLEDVSVLEIAEDFERRIASIYQKP